MITADQLKTIGIPGLLFGALVWLGSEYASEKAAHRETRQEHDEFIEMVIERYHLPLVAP